MSISNHKIEAILVVSVVVLAVICVASISSPMMFEKKMNQREQVVKARLAKIRVAENSFKRRYGRYCTSLDTLVAKQLLVDSLKFIPFCKKQKEFQLVTSVYVGHNGDAQSTMECSAAYEDFLDGLDENAVRETIQRAVDEGRYPGLKFGDVTMPNNNVGNWE